MPDREPDQFSRRAVIQRLESLRRAGVTDLRRAARPAAPGGSPPAPHARLNPANTAEALPLPEAASNPAPSPAPSAPLVLPDIPSMPNLPLDERCAALAALSRRVARCTRCAELAETRTQTVFGVGNPQAEVCFLGEAPGADEDRQGEPFVGRAGKLLNDILRASTFRREDVYILNILKCRPPGNRNPAAEEADNCAEYLQQQLEIIRPKYIVCLGAVAAANLLKTTTSIGKLRGKFHDYRGVKVLATYHPAYLLRNPAAKRHAWDDMKMLLGDMGIEIPTPTKSQSPKR